MISIRNKYMEMGVNQYYKTNADTYQNPHETIIQSLIKSSLSKINYGDNVLDLCCGNGLVTKILNNHVRNIYGNDPFMKKQYIEQTGKKCFDYNFTQLSTTTNLPKVDTIVCSFSLHLCEKSLLPNVLYNLSLIANKLIIITPNKKPEINLFWTLENETIQDKVRFRVYTKTS